MGSLGLPPIGLHRMSAETANPHITGMSCGRRCGLHPSWARQVYLLASYIGCKTDRRPAQCHGIRELDDIGVGLDGFTSHRVTYDDNQQQIPGVCLLMG